MEFASHNKQSAASSNAYSSELLPERRESRVNGAQQNHFLHHNDKAKSRHSNHESGPGDHELTSDPALVTASNGLLRASTPPSPITVSLPVPPVRYRECQKNHAANMGGHVVDGCGEFMAIGEEGTAESLICAACECHRNFHRKEIEGEPLPPSRPYLKNNGHRGALPHSQVQPPSASLFSSPRLSLHQHYNKYLQGGSAALAVSPIMMNFGNGGAESSSDDLNIFQTDMNGQSSGTHSLGKKRFRTKFNQEQKDKMMEFAEKIGWKMQKQDDEEVHRFCSQMGIKRKVFKVWMHNNKQAMKKKQTSES